VNRAEAFRRQAASELEVLELLLEQLDGVPSCHCLHYLQMVSEKAGKAVVCALGDELPRNGYAHRVAGSFVQALKRRSIGEALGWPRFD
jgi:hypothetical protein